MPYGPSSARRWPGDGAVVPVRWRSSRAPTTRTGTWSASSECRPLSAFDAVLMRQDPPFDFEYVTATWLLERGAGRRQGLQRPARDPRPLRELAITEFPEYAGHHPGES